MNDHQPSNSDNGFIVDSFCPKLLTMSLRVSTYSSSFKQQEMLDQNRRQILAWILFQETYVSRIPDSIAAIRFLNSLAAFPHDLC